MPIKKTVWSIIENLRKTEQMTVFLTTHYMEEAADADYIVILDAGKIAAEGTPLELKNRYTGDFITIWGGEKESIASLGVAYTEFKGGFRLSVADTRAATALIIKHPELFCDYEITKGKMDDVFLAVTGKTLEGGKDK